MQHLNGEEIARLLDEAPDAAETLHLEMCASCAAELDAMREQTVALGSLGDLPAPDRVWQAVQREIAAEGLPEMLSTASVAGWSWPLRAAAGFALFLLGAASGAVVTRAPAAEAEQPVAQHAATVDEAATVLQTAEDEYLQAIMRYAELTESGEGLDPVNRLAALEGIVLTTGAALREAPADPVINNYHLTALGQRDALLRQLEVPTEEEWF